MTYGASRAAEGVDKGWGGGIRQSSATTSYGDFGRRHGLQPRGEEVRIWGRRVTMAGTQRSEFGDETVRAKAFPR